MATVDRIDSLQAFHRAVGPAREPLNAAQAVIESVLCAQPPRDLMSPDMCLAVQLLMQQAHDAIAAFPQPMIEAFLSQPNASRLIEGAKEIARRGAYDEFKDTGGLSVGELTIVDNAIQSVQDIFDAMEHNLPAQRLAA